MDSSNNIAYAFRTVPQYVDKPLCLDAVLLGHSFTAGIGGVLLRFVGFTYPRNDTEHLPPLYTSSNTEPRISSSAKARARSGEER